jgi:hypothetical protein
VISDDVQAKEQDQGKQRGASQEVNAPPPPPTTPPTLATLSYMHQHNSPLTETVYSSGC